MKRLKILAYQIESENLEINDKVIWRDLKSWNLSMVDGNDPIMIINNSDNNPAGYIDISSIENFEELLSKSFEKYWQIKYLFDETDWGSLSLQEKKIVAKYFLVDKTTRDEVLTQQEQDDNNYFKIYNFLSEDIISQKSINNPFITPKSIDYKKEIDGRLHPKYTFDQYGWLVHCVYYENLNITQDAQGFTQYNYSNPVLEMTGEYVMKADGYVGSRTITRKWYRLDGTLDDDAKITEKFYEPVLARDEGKRRRRNIVNNLMIETVGLFIMTSQDLNTVTEAETDAMPFLKEISTGLSDYYEYGNKQDSLGNDFLLKDQILNSNYSRLDNFVPNTGDTVTIRQYLVSKVDV